MSSFHPPRHGGHGSVDNNPQVVPSMKHDAKSTNTAPLTTIANLPHTHGLNPAIMAAAPLNSFIHANMNPVHVPYGLPPITSIIPLTNATLPNPNLPNPTLPNPTILAEERPPAPQPPASTAHVNPSTSRRNGRVSTAATSESRRWVIEACTVLHDWGIPFMCRNKGAVYNWSPSQIENAVRNTIHARGLHIIESLHQPCDRGVYGTEGLRFFKCGKISGISGQISGNSKNPSHGGASAEGNSLPSQRNTTDSSNNEASSTTSASLSSSHTQADTNSDNASTLNDSNQEILVPCPLAVVEYKRHVLYHVLEHHPSHICTTRTISDFLQEIETVYVLHEMIRAHNIDPTQPLPVDVAGQRHLQANYFDGLHALVQRVVEHEVSCRLPGEDSTDNESEIAFSSVCRVTPSRLYAGIPELIKMFRNTKSRKPTPCYLWSDEAHRQMIVKVLDLEGGLSLSGELDISELMNQVITSGVGPSNPVVHHVMSGNNTRNPPNHLTQTTSSSQLPTQLSSQVLSTRNIVVPTQMHSQTGHLSRENPVSANIDSISGRSTSDANIGMGVTVSTGNHGAVTGMGVSMQLPNLSHEMLQNVTVNSVNNNTSLNTSLNTIVPTSVNGALAGNLSGTMSNTMTNLSLPNVNIAGVTIPTTLPGTTLNRNNITGAVAHLVSGVNIPAIVSSEEQNFRNPMISQVSSNQIPSQAMNAVTTMQTQPVNMNSQLNATSLPVKQATEALNTAAMHAMGTHLPTKGSQQLSANTSADMSINASQAPNHASGVSNTHQRVNTVSASIVHNPQNNTHPSTSPNTTNASDLASTTSLAALSALSMNAQQAHYQLFDLCYAAVVDRDRDAAEEEKSDTTSPLSSVVFTPPADLLALATSQWCPVLLRDAFPYYTSQIALRKEGKHAEDKMMDNDGDVHRNNSGNSVETWFAITTLLSSDKNDANPKDTAATDGASNNTTTLSLNSLVSLLKHAKTLTTAAFSSNDVTIDLWLPLKLTLSPTAFMHVCQDAAQAQRSGDAGSTVRIKAEVDLDARDILKYCPYGAKQGYGVTAKVIVDTVDSVDTTSQENMSQSRKTDLNSQHGAESGSLIATKPEHSLDDGDNEKDSNGKRKRAKYR